MLDKLRETIGTWLAVQLAPYIVKPPEPAAEAEPKPYVDPEKAALMEQCQKLETSNKLFEAQTEMFKAAHVVDTKEIGELKAQRNNLVATNAELTRTLAIAKSKADQDAARIADLEHVVEAVRTAVKG
jgi:hypothetical protein